MLGSSLPPKSITPLYCKCKIKVTQGNGYYRCQRYQLEAVGYVLLPICHEYLVSARLVDRENPCVHEAVDNYMARPQIALAFQNPILIEVVAENKCEVRGGTSVKFNPY